MNGDWIFELLLGGGILRVIFGLGGRCLLLGDDNAAGLVIIEVGVFTVFGEAMAAMIFVLDLIGFNLLSL